MTSKLRKLTGTALKFNGEAGADVAFSMEGVATGAGRVSAQKDFGDATSTAKGILHMWSCELLCQATPTQYETVDFYLATAPDSDATQIDGDVGSTDAALSDVDQLQNLQRIGSVVIEEANTTKMVGSGLITIMNRYASIVGFNQSGATINATDSNFIFTLTPYDLQGQDT